MTAVAVLKGFRWLSQLLFQLNLTSWTVLSVDNGNLADIQRVVVSLGVGSALGQSEISDIFIPAVGGRIQKFSV